MLSVTRAAASFLIEGRKVESSSERQVLRPLLQHHNLRIAAEPSRLLAQGAINDAILSEAIAGESETTACLALA